MKIIIIIGCIALLASCETKVTNTHNTDSTTSAGNILDTLENHINRGWDTVKSKVKEGSENININGDTLKEQIGETLREGSREIKKGADSLGNKIDRSFKKAFPDKNDTLKK